MLNCVDYNTDEIHLLWVFLIVVVLFLTIQFCTSVLLSSNGVSLLLETICAFLPMNPYIHFFPGLQSLNGTFRDSFFTTSCTKSKTRTCVDPLPSMTFPVTNSPLPPSAPVNNVAGPFTLYRSVSPVQRLQTNANDKSFSSRNVSTYTVESSSHALLLPWVHTLPPIFGLHTVSLLLG